MAGPRAQADRSLYKKHMQMAIRGCPNLSLAAGGVEDLVIGFCDEN
jgi:tRNA uridine 5-carboxymethylaminomethyl modification enzyme